MTVLSVFSYKSLQPCWNGTGRSGQQLYITIPSRDGWGKNVLKPSEQEQLSVKKRAFPIWSHIWLLFSPPIYSRSHKTVNKQPLKFSIFTVLCWIRKYFKIKCQLQFFKNMLFHSGSSCMYLNTHTMCFFLKLQDLASYSGYFRCL